MSFITLFYDVECKLFRYINKLYERKHLNRFLYNVTHLGGAVFTISAVLLMLLFTRDLLQITAMASGMALAISHIPVAIVKKVFPRKRPYLVLNQIHVIDNPLKDHSFPSGHTTAIFSLITPFILYQPILAYVLLPIGFIIGFSRIYLGLHYPTDVVVGFLLGSTTGVFSFRMMKNIFSVL